MKQQERRITALEAETDPAPEFDASILTDEELKFYDETLTKAGYGLDTEGDLSLLSDEELKRIESINKKALA